MFIVGPAGVGKSTCGRLLADQLDFDFVDLDTEFIQRIGGIQRWIDEHGYLAYCHANSELFRRIIEEHPTNSVHAVSSGFLMYEQLDGSLRTNREILAASGVSISLLPADSLAECRDIVMGRLLKRRPWLDRAHEAEKFEQRYEVYHQFGDVRIASRDEPPIVAQQMAASYFDYLKEHELNDLSSSDVRSRYGPPP